VLDLASVCLKGDDGCEARWRLEISIPDNDGADGVSLFYFVEAPSLPGMEILSPISDCVHLSTIQPINKYKLVWRVVWCLYVSQTSLCLLIIGCTVETCDAVVDPLVLSIKLLSIDQVSNIHVWGQLTGILLSRTKGPPYRRRIILLDPVNACKPNPATSCEREMWLVAGFSLRGIEGRKEGLSPSPTGYPSHSSLKTNINCRPSLFLLSTIYILF